jgi:microcin C transport system permease protein
LFAEFIANEKPLIVKYDGQYYFPVLFNYTETTFGGEFKTFAKYRDPHVQNLIKKKDGWMIWPPIRYSYQTINYDAHAQAPASPTWENLLGTDTVHRDVLTRVIYGFRLSVLFGLALTFLSSIIGITAGAVQGYFGGWVDLLFQRFIEIWTSIPSLFVLLIIVTALDPNFVVLLLVLLLFSWVSLVAVVRAEFLRTRNFEYIQAARAMGLSNSRIIIKHMLPNAMVATLTFMPFILVHSITALTSLDFLGYGLPPDTPSLGELLLQGKRNPYSPWLSLTAFFVISIMLSLLVFIGEAVRDAFDPRKIYK